MTEWTNPWDAYSPPSPDLTLSLSSAISETLGPFSSPTGALGWACEQVFGKDPFTWVTDQVDGDWEALSKAADCLIQMGAWIDTSASNAQYFAYRSGASWEGNAALAAHGQFMDMGAKVAPAADIVRESGRATEWIATQVFALGVLSAELVEATVNYLAAYLFPPTLVFAIIKAFDTALKILGLISKALAAVQVVIGAMQGEVDKLSALPAIAVSSGYDNPMVR